MENDVPDTVKAGEAGGGSVVHRDGESDDDDWVVMGNGTVRYTVQRHG